MLLLLLLLLNKVTEVVYWQCNLFLSTLAMRHCRRWDGSNQEGVMSGPPLSCHIVSFFMNDIKLENQLLIWFTQKNDVKRHVVLLSESPDVQSVVKHIIDLCCPFDAKVDRFEFADGRNFYTPMTLFYLLQQLALKVQGGSLYQG